MSDRSWVDEKDVAICQCIYKDIIKSGQTYYSIRTLGYTNYIRWWHNGEYKQWLHSQNFGCLSHAAILDIMKANKHKNSCS